MRSSLRALMLRAVGWRREWDDFLWRKEEDGRLRTALRTAGVALWKFQEDRGFLRASALTYTTLLSIVPLLALAFSILKGLGVQQRLEPMILERLAAGNEDLAQRILGYVDRTDMRSLGAAGLVGLLLTAISVLGNVELSFNDIWQVHQGRTFIRKVTDYLAMIVVTPVLLLASLSMATALQSKNMNEVLLLLGPALHLLVRAVPFAITVLALTTGYLIMPNRRVSISSALLGGVVAGVLWHLAEWGYIRFQFGVAKYNAIYGAMAQLPILLVWLYSSWCIVLLGAELAFVHGSPGAGRLLGRRPAHWTLRLDTALPVLVAVARRYENGLPAATEAELAAEVGFASEPAARVLAHLVETGLLAQTNDEPPRVLPARAPDRTSVADLLEILVGVPPVLSVELKALRDESSKTWADLALGRTP